MATASHGNADPAARMIFPKRKSAGALSVKEHTLWKGEGRAVGRLDNVLVPFNGHRSHQCQRNICLGDGRMRPLLKSVKPNTLKNYSCSVLLI